MKKIDKTTSRSGKLKSISVETIRVLTTPELSPVRGGMLDTCPAASRDTIIPTCCITAMCP